MDEMNPAFENFLNNMSRLGGTPKETTRRVSASNFLGKENKLEARVNNNSKKINVITRILKARRANTVGIEKSIMDIRETMSSIVQTLEAQEKFEYEKFLDTQRKLENEKRRDREASLEEDKPLVKMFKKATNNALAPVKNAFLQTLQFFINLIAGKFLMGILNFLSNPANIGLVNFISGFIKNFFPLILTGITAAIIGVGFLIGKMIGLTGILKAAALIFGFGMPGTSLISGGAKAIGKTNFFKSAVSAFRPDRLFMQDGGKLEGPSHAQGGIPIEAEGGECIVNPTQTAKFLPLLETINEGVTGGIRGAKRIFNTGKNVRFPDESKVPFGDIRDLFKRDTSKVNKNTLFGDDRLQRGQSTKNYKSGKQSTAFGRPDRAFGIDLVESFKNRKLVTVSASEGGPMSGITPAQRELILRPFRSLFSGGAAGLSKKGVKLYILSELMKATPLADGTLEGNMNLLPINPNDGGQPTLPDFSNIPNIPSPDKIVPSRNELPTCSLNPSDSNKCDTLGMIAP